MPTMQFESGGRDNCDAHNQHMLSLLLPNVLHVREVTRKLALAEKLPIATMMQYVVSSSSSLHAVI